MKKTGQTVLSLLLSLLFVCCTAGAATTSFAVDGTAQEPVTIRVSNCENEVTIDYKESKQFDFETANRPLDATVHVYCNGEDRGESEYIYVKEPTADYTVEAKVLGADGAVLAESGVVKVTVRSGIFDRIKASIKKTFGTAADAVMDILGAIFMRIWIFLHR